MNLVQHYINILNYKLKKSHGEIGYLILNRDSGLYDIRETNQYGGSSGGEFVENRNCKQFAIEKDAIEFLKQRITYVQKQQSNS